MGKNCDLERSYCDSKPCLNDGDCVQDDSKIFHCECTSGFEGDFCETEMNECESSPCTSSIVNNGFCHDFVDGYACDCKPGYTITYDLSVNFVPGTKFPVSIDDNCAIEIDECSSDPCLNGGTCEDLVNIFVCDCETGWSGENCQYRNNACDVFPCPVYSTCLDDATDPSKYECVCPNRYEGKKCDREIDLCVSNPGCVQGICESSWISDTEWFSRNKTEIVNNDSNLSFVPKFILNLFFLNDLE